MSVALIHDPICLKHQPGGGHPEQVARIERLMPAIERAPFAGDLLRIQPEAADRRWLETVHDPDYLDFVDGAWAAGRRVLDGGDTRIAEQSAEAARVTAGAALAAVDAVLADGQRAAFSAMRPPGHHARPMTAMGFCLYGNIAIAARYAQQHYKLKRVLIVDWDVHHGNGTQEMFYDDPSVGFLSIHQHPCYPGTGAATETGSGPGEGFTLNVPVSAGSDGAVYQRVFEQSLVTFAESIQPELILISAGFDAHRDDPLAQVNLTEADFGSLTERVMALADRHCQGRIVSLLEGGYHLEAMPASVVEHLRVLNG
ncbi:MAG: histone deacetylase family protein [Opitutales bacterium]